MHKPKYLYHASSNTQIEIFEPRAESIRHRGEGPVVFAGEDKYSCTVFLVPTTSDWVELGSFRDESGERFQFAIISDEKRFKENDKGGAIYKLPAETFFINEEINPKSSEWTSKVAVKPISKEIHKSGLQAMMNAGIQVFFIDLKTFKKIKESNDHGYKIIKTLTSENEKMGMNFKNLDMDK